MLTIVDCRSRDRYRAREEMRFFTRCLHVPVDEIVAFAVRAEQLGYDGLSMGDHVVFPVECASVLPYTPDGSRNFSEETDWPDAMTAFAAISSVTRTLELVTGILIAPLRHPIHLAKIGRAHV